MSVNASEAPSIIEALSSLRDELSRLADRVSALETRLTESATSASKTTSAAQAAGVDEELLAVISATIAAYLGCKPHIRQVRLVGSTNWVQYGRVTIQASHNMPTYHG